MTKQEVLDLRLHGEAAAAPAGEGSAAAPAGEAEGVQSSPKVLYGKQDADPAGQEARQKERKAEWKKLISEDYKEEFGQSVQQAIERRFRQAKPMEERLNKLNPIADMLAERYGLAEADPDQLMQALEADNIYWEDAAAEAGLSVAQYREMKRLERENARFQAEVQRQEAEKKAQSQIAEWERQATELREIYPLFDLREECENPQFVKLLGHVPMRAAYEALHMQEIMAGAVQRTARAVERGVTETIRAKGQRPAETGLKPSPGVEVKSDPSTLSRRDLKRIRELVQQGVKIKF